jgi:hypothetical protein
MKSKVVILSFVSLLLFSCAPATPTQEDEVVEIVTEEIVTKESVSEPIATEEPTETPIACVTLLSPVNGAEIPPVGKVTFSWTPMDEAGNYVLNIILPSGEIVPFETDQTFRDRFMEAFVAGGEYEWQVVAQGVDGSEICVSEVATFEKPAYIKTNDGGNGGNAGSGGDGGSGGGSCTGCTDGDD